MPGWTRPKPPRWPRRPKADAEVDNDVLPTARAAVATTIMVLRIPNLLRGCVLHPSRFLRTILMRLSASFYCTAYWLLYPHALASRVKPCKSRPIAVNERGDP